MGVCFFLRSGLFLEDDDFFFSRLTDCQDPVVTVLSWVWVSTVRPGAAVSHVQQRQQHQVVCVEQKFDFCIVYGWVQGLQRQRPFLHKYSAVFHLIRPLNILALFALNQIKPLQSVLFHSMAVFRTRGMTWNTTEHRHFQNNNGRWTVCWGASASCAFLYHSSNTGRVAVHRVCGSKTCWRRTWRETESDVRQKGL